MSCQTSSRREYGVTTAHLPDQSTRNRAARWSHRLISLTLVSREGLLVGCVMEVDDERELEDDFEDGFDVVVVDDVDIDDGSGLPSSEPPLRRDVMR
jgi:hypothetical protein